MTALDCEKFEIRYTQGFTVSYHAITILQYSIETIFTENILVFSEQKYLLATEDESYKI